MKLRMTVIVLTSSLGSMCSAAWADAIAFDDLYQLFIEERTDVHDGVSARQFVEQLGQVLPPEDETRVLQYELVACFYENLHDLPRQAELGASGHDQARARSMNREAALFRVCQANALEQLGHSGDALALFREALSLAQDSGDRNAEAIARYWLGSALNLQGYAGEALGEYLQAQSMLEALGQVSRARSLDIDIAILYRRIGRPERAEQILRDLQPYLDSDAETLLEDRLALLAQLAIALNAQQRHEEALEFFALADSALAGSQLPTWERALTGLPAASLTALGRHEEALERLEQAIELHAAIGGAAMGDLSLVKAEALLGLGQHEQALALLLELQDDLDVTNSFLLRSQWHETLARALVALDRHAEAYEHLLAAREVDQELRHLNDDQQLIALRASFEAQERERVLRQRESEAALKQAEIEALERLQFWQMTALAGLLFIIGGLLFWGSQQRRQGRAMSVLARRDPLTQLANRRGFLDAADEMLKRSAMEKGNTSLLAIDIDRFKNINDRYGHPVGDQVLEAFATVLRKSARDGDLVGRIGGEEFSMLLPKSGLTDSKRVAERVRSALEALDLETLAPGLRLTCSIGVASTEEPGCETLGDLLMNADRRLYRAKESGRDQVIAS